MGHPLPALDVSFTSFIVFFDFFRGINYNLINLFFLRVHNIKCL
jgi:hypothetical protein